MASAQSPTEIYVTALRNAHAMESEASQMLQRQLERLGADYPELRSKLEDHTKLTSTHLSRLDAVLAAAGEKHSGFKDLVTSTVGNAAMLGNAISPDAVLKNTFVAISYSALEVAAYKSLFVTAELAGEKAAVEPLLQSLQEEQIFGDWLEGHIEQLTRDYTAYAISSAGYR